MDSNIKTYRLEETPQRQGSIKLYSHQLHWIQPRPKNRIK